MSKQHVHGTHAVAPEEGSQQSKYAESIKVFGIVETLDNGVGRIALCSLSIVFFILSLYIF